MRFSQQIGAMVKQHSSLHMLGSRRVKTRGLCLCVWPAFVSRMCEPKNVSVRKICYPFLLFAIADGFLGA